MNSTPAERMPPILLPAELDILIEFRDGTVGIATTSPSGEEVPVSRVELTTLFGLASMSVGYDAHSQDIEQE